LQRFAAAGRQLVPRDALGTAGPPAQPDRAAAVGQTRLARPKALNAIAVNATAPVLLEALRAAIRRSLAAGPFGASVSRPSSLARIASASRCAGLCSLALE
jgi:hypothetical protein